MHAAPLASANARTAGASLAVALLCLLLAGCNREMQMDGATSVDGTPVALAPQANSPVVDLPIPVGFTISDKDSEAQVTRADRYVSHYYRGKAEPDQVVRFYREQLPMSYKWKLDFYRNAKGVWRLHYTKLGGAERCSITISENWWGTTTIYAEIYPVAGER